MNFKNYIFIGAGAETIKGLFGLEDTSGEGEQECWFGEGCQELSEMESGSWRGCCQSGVNSATPIKGINPVQNWINLVGLGEFFQIIFLINIMCTV